MKTWDHLWIIILAAGEGKRLESYRIAENERPIPKQFRIFDGYESMLQWTVKRAEAIVPKERVIAIVAHDHHRWWRSQLSALPTDNVVIQPQNKGTAVGILLPLWLVLERDPKASVIILPSDHYVDDEQLLLEAVRGASRLAQINAQRVVLVGMDPTQDATDYGWILPGVSEIDRGSRRVSNFWEKPDLSTVERLRRRGALVNSLIVAAGGRALLNLFSVATPRLVGEFSLHMDEKTGRLREIREIYDQLPVSDFSRDVLERSPEHLLVYPAPPACGWSDLGTPARMSHFLERHQDTAA